jgi:nucleoside-diphosphate-sugar epimerase
MKVLFIGGTGNISTSVSKLAVERGLDLYLFNRGTHGSPIAGAKTIAGDIGDPVSTARALKGHEWDVVVNWIAFREPDVHRDVELFTGKTGQYIFISSASCYQKPPLSPFITESTPLSNPFWQYSRDKIACERFLSERHRTDGFPMTIVRPSLTYDTVIPLPIGGWKEYTVIERMRTGRKVIVHGDGTSLWVMTHAEDFAKGFLGVLGRREAIGEAFHITTDEVLTWDQIYQAVAAAAGTVARIVHIPSEVLASYSDELRGSLLGDKARSAVFNNAKIKRLVPDFSATIPFSDGIRRTLAWFEADSSRRMIRKETHEFMDKIIDKFERAFPL